MEPCCRCDGLVKNNCWKENGYRNAIRNPNAKWTYAKLQTLSVFYSRCKRAFHKIVLLNLILQHNVQLVKSNFSPLLKCGTREHFYIRALLPSLPSFLCLLMINNKCNCNNDDIIVMMMIIKMIPSKGLTIRCCWFAGSKGSRI